MHSIKIEYQRSMLNKCSIPFLCNKNTLFKKLSFRIYGKQGLLVKQPILRAKSAIKNWVFLEKHFLAHKYEMQAHCYHFIENFAGHKIHARSPLSKHLLYISTIKICTHLSSIERSHCMAIKIHSKGGMQNKQNKENTKIILDKLKLFCIVCSWFH